MNINDYVIDPRCTRQGGMAIVYKGTRPGAFQSKALKMIRPDRAANNTSLCQRFVQEVRLLGSLDHPNIVKAEGAFQFRDENGNTYTVLEMEWLNGLNLKEYIEQREPDGIQSEEELQKIALRILEALDYAHNRHILHLDIKPSNIFRTRDGYIKLVDFGIAKVIGEQAENIQGAEEYTLTRTESGESTFRGTLAYASPEQTLGKGVDQRSDIYSFGKTLNYIMTGNDSMSSGRFSLFNEVVEKCTHARPDLRFSNCREVIEYIENERQRTRFCINCKASISADFRFCPYCSADQNKGNDLFRCPSCKNSYDKKSAVCPYCGTPKGQTVKMGKYICLECGKPYTYPLDATKAYLCGSCNSNNKLVIAQNCPHCKKLIRSGDKFCIYCGERV